MNEELRLKVDADPAPRFNGGSVDMVWHRPRTETTRGQYAILCLPIQGGDYEVSTRFARHFASRGFHALRFERRAEWLDASRPLDELAALVEQFVKDVELGVSQWLALTDNPVTRIGLFGVSMGAKIGTLVTANDPRIEGAVLCIGGADLEEVLLTGRDGELDQYREALLAAPGETLATLREKLINALSSVRLTEQAPRCVPRPLLMFAARFDRVVPWSASVRLHQALDRPPRVTLPCGHYSAALFIPLIQWRSVRFFDDLFGGHS